MKKILYIVTQSEWGGAQKYVYDLVDNLSTDQYDLCVASGKSNTNELPNKLISKNVKIIRLKHLQREINLLVDLRATLELYRLIRSEQPDIVHLNSTKAGVIGSIAAFLARVPQILYTAHGWVFNEPNATLKNTVYYIAEKISSYLKDDIICVSHYDERVAKKRNIRPRGRLLTIHNGINLGTLNFYEKETARELLSEKINKELPAHAHLIGAIGNLYKTKGHGFLIDAAKKLPESVFVILGEGIERPYLEQQIQSNRLEDRFFLPGSVINAFQFIKAFDIFALPSVKEGLSYTLLEAVASGVPIVATNVGGTPEIINSENLVPPGDADALALALKQTTRATQPKVTDISVATMVRQTALLYE